MELSLKVRTRDASEAIRELEKADILDKSRKITNIIDSVYIPITSDKLPHLSFETAISKRKLKRRNEHKTLKEEAATFLENEELEKLKTSFDIVGDLAIMEIDEELRAKEKKIAEALLRTNRIIKGVFRKGSAHSGRFRTQRMEHLAGVQRTETLHKENGVRLKLDIEKVYFSARQSTERKRVAGKVRDGEIILVLFSGCAPFPCVISKNSDSGAIFGVEINPEGHKYGEDNVKLNKLKNVFLTNKDAKDTEGIDNDFKGNEHYKGVFDRIVMPHPSECESFLPYALKFADKGTRIHLYTFSDEDKIAEKEEEASTICRKHGFSPRADESVLCGQHSPGHYRICIDIILE